MRIHPDIKDKTVWEVFLDEQKSFIHVSRDFDAYIDKQCSISKTQLIQFDTNEIEDLINQREESLQSEEENLEKLEAQQASTMESFDADLKTINNNYELANLTFENMRYESESKRQEAKLQYDNAKLNYDAQITKIENQIIINRVDKNNRLRNIEEEKNDLEWAKAQLKRLTVTAPSPGLVVYKETFSVGAFEKVEIGDNVFPQQPLIELPDLTEIQVKMKVNEIDVDKYEYEE